MTRLSSTAIAERKAQLATRAALERMRLTLAMHSVRAAVMPPLPPGSRARRPIVAALVTFAARRVGPAKLRRWIRIAQYATIAYRIVSNWQR